MIEYLPLPTFCHCRHIVATPTAMRRYCHYRHTLMPPFAALSDIPPLATWPPRYVIIVITLPPRWPWHMAGAPSASLALLMAVAADCAP